MFINLTPHVVILPNGDRIPSSGVVRCPEKTIPVKEHNGVILCTRSYGRVTLPEPKSDTIYLVSSYVRVRHPERTDLATPSDLERDGNGNIIRARSLIVNRERIA